MDGLSSDNLQPMQEFKADLSRKTPCRAEKRKCIEAEIVSIKTILFSFGLYKYFLLKADVFALKVFLLQLE